MLRLLRSLAAVVWIALLLAPPAHAELGPARRGPRIDALPAGAPEPCLGRVDAGASAGLSVSLTSSGSIPLASPALEAGLGRCLAEPVRSGRRLTVRNLVRRLPGRRVPRMHASQPPPASGC